MLPETSDRTWQYQTRFDDALARFDQANAEDPNRELVGDAPQPKELVYAQRMTE